MTTPYSILADALRRNRLLGTREFFLREGEMLSLLRYLVCQPPGPVVSLNRPHTAGQCFIHRAAWLGLTFVCVSFRPFMLS
jgi:hypothetical protein